MPASDERLTGLYEKYNRAIRAYCLRRLGDDEALDATAEVFTVAWRRIGDVPEGESALPWLYGVARRVVADHYRSQNRLARLTTKLRGVRPVAPTQPDWQVIQRAEYHLVQSALGGLREKDREVLLLAAWEELRNDQIAAVIGCTTDAAAQRVHRAKQRLGRSFRALSHDGPSSTVADGGATA